MTPPTTSPVPSSGDAGLVERLRAAYNAWNNPPSEGLPTDAGCVLEAAARLEALTQQQEQVEVRAWEYDTGDEWDVSTDEAKAARLSEIIPVQPLIRLTDHQAIVAEKDREIDELDFLLHEGGTWEEQLSKAETRISTLEQELAEAREAISGLLACPAIADGDQSDPEWGDGETAEAERRARAALNGGAK